ncbi:hypothetical protein [Pseudomonas chlororaphis]|uniref:Uncharacterized protein n=1 Tax=Pseudomonas chlororaphis TaxID=587753 RepID=A0A0D5Y4M7_9PSED|nr:hypothetical protein [Pseudomonas chlororaphis]AKA25957.1 hypothetical protein PCL1606_45100 [Pseudomonas chlororaphis]
MKISLIENGLDSFRKGYQHLEKYEQLAKNKADDAARFSELKDSVLSIQHGIEILFKFILKKHNDLLIYTDISKLKQAFKSQRNGTISELYEAEGVHTVTFKESIERLRDICGLEFDEDFRKTLLKVESWRNSITHSAVLLNEEDVARVLMSLLADLDNFFGPAIGEEYLKAQGRPALDRAYKLTKAVYGELENRIKAATVERLISALEENDIKNVTAPGVFLINDPGKAFSILQKIQGDGINYGCDLINGHCSGSASVVNLTDNKIISIDTTDNRCEYRFNLDAIVVYIPKIQDSFSPLIFMYSNSVPPLGKKPYIREDEDYTLQIGLAFEESGHECWETSDIQQSFEDYNSEYDPVLPSNREIIKFISEGPVCFMNVQKLEYGSAQRLLHATNHRVAENLFTAFKQHLEKPE